MRGTAAPRTQSPRRVRSCFSLSILRPAHLQAVAGRSFTKSYKFSTNGL
jgi:hypothetical protein